VTSLDWLETASLFRGVPAPVVSSALATASRRSLMDGEVLLEPGSRNQHLFVLLQGSLQIRLAGGAASGTIEVLPGECVGEFSIIDGQPTSARVVASGICEVLLLPEEFVCAELIPAPSFARNLLQILTRRLRRAAQGQAAYERLLQELQVARQIQSSMLPRGERMFPDHPEVGCAAAMDAAAEVGGDFFDAFFLDDRHLFFAVGDVSGKGIGAALFMARCLTQLRQEALKRRPMRELAARLNAALVEGNEGGHFLALFAGILDTTSGETRFVNGGLGAPLVRRGDRWERPVMPRGLVLGIFPEFEYGPGRLRLRTGDALAVFTDGVTDAASSDGEAFGEPRLAALLTDSGSASAPALVAAVQAGVRSYVKGAPAVDDFTLLIVERRSVDLISDTT
jgi:sigma-B regulation protein RsbU (phosphoserine phosphatase)